MVATPAVTAILSASAIGAASLELPLVNSISKNDMSGPGSSSMWSGRSSLNSSVAGLPISCRKSERALIGPSAPIRKMKPSSLRKANSFATWRFVTSTFSPTSQPVPTHSSRPPCSSTRPTERMARSRLSLAPTRRSFQIWLSALSANTSSVVFFLMARIGRVRRRMMLSSWTRSSVVWVAAGSSITSARRSMLSSWRCGSCCRISALSPRTFARISSVLLMTPSRSSRLPAATTLSS